VGLKATFYIIYLKRIIQFSKNVDTFGSGFFTLTSRPKVLRDRPKNNTNSSSSSSNNNNILSKQKS